MSVRISPLKLKLAAVLTASATAAALGVGVAAAPAGATAPTMQPHRVKVFPDAVKVSTNTNAAQFTCQGRPIDGSQGIVCYDPAQVQKAYDVSPLLAQGKDGTGRTIVIVDAFQNPYIQSDLASFDQLFGLPDPVFVNHVMPGTPAFDPNDDNQVGWGSETTLDVLWAHAIAPGAKIVLVSAASNQDTDILAATQFAVDNDLGDVLSQSFGENENCVDPTLLDAEHQMFDKATKQGWTVFASSGDSGAAQFTCDGSGAVKVASSPASDPLVTGVGGTTLSADIDGNYQGETAWTEGIFAGCNAPAVADADINCSGGGFSDLYAQPKFQRSAFKADGKGKGKGTLGRGVPDIAYNAGVNGGVLTVCSVCNNGVPAVFLFGGTSAGTPQWAGLTAIADQVAHHRLGDINPTLYKIADNKNRFAATMHDVTVGNNDVAEIGGGFETAKGWDPVTGLGTPKAAQLVPMLIKRAK
jgi:subtilase family serine protease